ncbi:MAG: hypothetical protein R3Y09_06220 [Clostridia bacterium]
MKGYKAKNHYLAIKKWVVNAVAEQNAKATKQDKSLLASTERSGELEQWELELMRDLENG